VVVLNAKSLYKRVELTGTSEEYLLMHVVGVGDLVKNLYFTFDEEWVGDLNVQKKKLDVFCDQSYKNVSSLAASRKLIHPLHRKKYHV